MRNPNRLPALVATLLLVPATLRALTFAYYAALAIPHPIETFHLEAKMVSHAWRFLAGLPLYPPWDSIPSLPNFFGPLHPVLLGGIAELLRLDPDRPATLDQLFLIGRSLSLAAAVLPAVALAALLSASPDPAAPLPARARILRFLLLLALALGPAPLYGFAVMTRADTLADALGVLGFLLVVGLRNPNLPRPPTPARLALGGLLLVLAPLARQTAAVYLLAAALALAANGNKRAAAALLASAAAALLAVVLLVTLAFEPLFARSLLGEAAAPFSLEHGARLLLRVLRESADLPLALLLGLVLWTTPPARDLPRAALAAAVLLAALLTTPKLGSDLNYLLPWRHVEILLAATLLDLARRPPPADRPRFARLALAAAAALLAAALVPSMIRLASETAKIETLRNYFRDDDGRRYLVARDRLRQSLLEPDAPPILTDSGLLALHLRERAPFVDPWLFRLMAVTGRVDPSPLARALEDRQYQRLLLTSDLFSDVYDSYEFGLPPQLLPPARRNYRFLGRFGDAFVYEPLPD